MDKYTFTWLSPDMLCRCSVKSIRLNMPEGKCKKREPWVLMLEHRFVATLGCGAEIPRLEAVVDLHVTEPR